MLKAHKTDVIGWFEKNIITLRSGVQVVVIDEADDSVVSGLGWEDPSRVGEYTREIKCPICFKKVFVRRMSKQKQLTCSVRCGKIYADRKRKGP